MSSLGGLRHRVASGVLALALCATCTKGEEAKEDRGEYGPCDDNCKLVACVAGSEGDLCSPFCDDDADCPALEGYDVRCDGCACVVDCATDDDCQEGAICEDNYCMWPYGGDGPECSECGAALCHSEVVDDVCVCEAGYDWCNPDPDDFECCLADSTQRTQVSMR